MCTYLKQQNLILLIILQYRRLIVNTFGNYFRSLRKLKIIMSLTNIRINVFHLRFTYVLQFWVILICYFFVTKNNKKYGVAPYFLKEGPEVERFKMYRFSEKLSHVLKYHP